MTHSMTMAWEHPTWGRCELTREVEEESFEFAGGGPAPRMAIQRPPTWTLRVAGQVYRRYTSCGPWSHELRYHSSEGPDIPANLPEIVLGRDGEVIPLPEDSPLWVGEQQATPVAVSAEPVRQTRVWWEPLGSIEDSPSWVDGPFEEPGRYRLGTPVEAPGGAVGARTSTPEPRDLLDRIDDLTAPRCGQCGRRLFPDGPSGEFCGQSCADAWRHAQVDEEPDDDLGGSGSAEFQRRELASHRPSGTLGEGWRPRAEQVQEEVAAPPREGLEPHWVIFDETHMWAGDEYRRRRALEARLRNHG